MTEVAITRLREREASIQAGTETSSIEPSIYITKGYEASVISNILKVIGT